MASRVCIFIPLLLTFRLQNINRKNNSTVCVLGILSSADIFQSYFLEHILQK